MKKLKWIVALMIGTAPAVTGGYLNSQEHAPCADFYYVLCDDWNQQCRAKPCSFNTLGALCDRGWEATGFPGIVLSNALPNSGLGLHMGHVQGIQEGEYRCGEEFDCKCSARFVSIFQTVYECKHKEVTGPWNWPDYPYLEVCPSPPNAP